MRKNSNILKILEEKLPFNFESLTLSLLPLLKLKKIELDSRILKILKFVCRHKLDISRREWVRFVYEILDLMANRSKRIRKTCSKVIGRIAHRIGYTQIIHILLDHLKIPDRSYRLGCSQALAYLLEFTAPPFDNALSFSGVFRA